MELPENTFAPDLKSGGSNNVVSALITLSCLQTFSEFSHHSVLINITPQLQNQLFHMVFYFKTLELRYFLKLG